MTARSLLLLLLPCLLVPATSLDPPKRHVASPILETPNREDWIWDPEYWKSLAEQYGVNVDKKETGGAILRRKLAHGLGWCLLVGGIWGSRHSEETLWLPLSVVSFMVHVPTQLAQICVGLALVWIYATRVFGNLESPLSWFVPYLAGLYLIKQACHRDGKRKKRYKHLKFTESCTQANLRRMWRSS